MCEHSKSRVYVSHRYVYARMNYDQLYNSSVCAIANIKGAKAAPNAMCDVVAVVDDVFATNTARHIICTLVSALEISIINMFPVRAGNACGLAAHFMRSRKCNPH